MEANRAFAALTLGTAIALAGCFYPPLSMSPPAGPNSIRLAVPYDLAWDAVNAVIRQNSYSIRAQDPNHGIIEAQGTSFTGQDADCGEFRNLGGRFPVEPAIDSSAEYNFQLKPDGPEACRIGVEGTFVTPLTIPFHPPSDVQCVSRGTNEARLLKQVQQQASLEHRPVYNRN